MAPAGSEDASYSQLFTCKSKRSVSEQLALSQELQGRFFGEATGKEDRGLE